MYKQISYNRSKLKNFAPKILLCAGLALMTIRNANIVTDSMPIITPYKLYLWLLITLFTKILGGWGEAVRKPIRIVNS